MNNTNAVSNQVMDNNASYNATKGGGSGGAGTAEALRAALESTKLVSAHYTKKVLRDKVLVVGRSKYLSNFQSQLGVHSLSSRECSGDAGVGKSTILASFVSGGSDVPKSYNMVRLILQEYLLCVV